MSSANRPSDGEQLVGGLGGGPAHRTHRLDLHGRVAHRELRAGNQRDRLTGLGNEVLVTFPRDAPDSLRHEDTASLQADTTTHPGR